MKWGCRGEKKKDGVRIGREDHVSDQLALLGVIFNQKLRTGLYTVQ